MIIVKKNKFKKKIKNERDETQFWLFVVLRMLPLLWFSLYLFCCGASGVVSGGEAV